MDGSENEAHHIHAGETEERKLKQLQMQFLHRLQIVADEAENEQHQQKQADVVAMLEASAIFFHKICWLFINLVINLGGVIQSLFYSVDSVVSSTN